MRLALSAVVLAAMASPALAHPGHHGHRHLADVVRDEPAPRALEARVGPRPITLYVNRDGGTLSGGYDDSANNVSSVVYGIADSIDVPAWKGSDKNWNKVVDCVKQGFADFQVDVVTDRPSSGDYVMIMVGGRPRMLNYPTSVAGVAPYTAEVIPNAIGFVFAAGNDYDVEQNCIDVMHEAGHAMGLDHESLCSDPMSYDWSCGAKTWQDQDSRCGETTDDERDCGDGNATQNSYQVLAANVGLRRDDAPPSETPPVEQNPPPSDDDQSDDGGYYDSGSSDDDLGVSIDDPGKSVAGNQWIEIDVRTQGDAADVELGWASQDQQWVFDCNDIDADQPAKCTRDGDLWKFELHVGTGVRAMAARATDQDGNQETTDARVVDLVAACGGGSAGPDASTAAPVVTITAPAENAVITGGVRVVTVTGSITTARTIRDVSATGEFSGTIEGASFAITVTLADNASTIEVTATDDLGQSGSASVDVDYPFVALTTFEDASLVLGEPDFTTVTPVGTVTPVSLGESFGGAAWDGHVLWVADCSGNRVLGWRGFPSRDGEPADLVLGQPDLQTSTPGNGAAQLSCPMRVRVHDGHLYVLDYENYRILRWDTIPTTSSVPADAVLGQAGFGVTSTTCDARTLWYPEDFTFAGEKMIVDDSSHARILIWNTAPADGSVDADVVLGEASFTNCHANDDNQDGVSDGSPTARTVTYPGEAWSDGTRLAVVDMYNNRVLLWDAMPTTSFTPADHVLGQPTPTAAAAATGISRLSNPYSIDSNGNQIAVGDANNNRVMVWNSIPGVDGAAADVVLGQSDFDHAAFDDDDQDGTADATPSARTLKGSSGVRFVRDALVIGDDANHRALVFGPLPCPSGQYETASGCVDDPCIGACAGQYCANDTGAAVCTAP